MAEQVAVPAVAVTVEKPLAGDGVKVAEKINAEMDALHKLTPIRQDFHEMYEKITNPPAERDEKGRFLPKDGEAKKEEPANDKKAEAVVPDAADAGDEQPAEVEADTAPEVADEPAASDDDALDVGLVAKAARLGLSDEDINEYSNAELKAVVKVLEKREVKVDKKATTSEQVDAKLSKDEPAADDEAVDYDKLIEDGHDERLVKHLKSLAETVKRLTANEKATIERQKAEEVSRETAEVDEWFDARGEQYGKGNLESLEKGASVAEVKARKATYEQAAIIAKGYRAEGKQLPPLAELLEMGHAIVHRKTVERDVARKVSKTIQDNKNKKTVAPPAAPVAQPKLNGKPDMRRDFQETASELGIRW